jgi:hypothetical protein
MTARRSLRWSVVVCVLLCVAALIYPSDLLANLEPPVFLSPVDGEYYESADDMTISFLLYSCNPYVDELRPIYFYLFIVYNDFASYMEISEYGNISDVIAVDWQWDSRRELYVARIDETFRVPKSDRNSTYIADCKAALTIDLPLDQFGLYAHTDGWFTVKFIKKHIPEKIPIIDPGPEVGSGRELDGDDDHMVSAPYPNPFNPNTTICFSVRESANVSLAIYDVNGRVVKTFYNDMPMSPGDRTEIWDGRNDLGVEVVSGVYFLRFNAGNHSEIRKMILMR